MGEDNKREATGDEIAAMVKLLATEMKSGALGLSTGIEYEPGIYSSHEEVLTLAKEAARLGGRYISHMRSEDRYFWDSVEEIINIGRVTGMPVQISHIKLAAKDIWGQTDKLLKRLNEARANGINITADIYPYEYWQSTLWVILPERDADDLIEIQYVLDNMTPADGIIFMNYEANPSYVGKSIAEIAPTLGLTEAETVSHLLKESKAWSEANGGQGAQSIMGKSMVNSDIAEIMKWAFTNICSDGGYEGHPRGYGAFPRFLSHFVKGMGIMSMEEGIRHMTSLPALNMGFEDRGKIKVGYAADLVLFNADIIKDNADLADRQAISTGIEKVWVNGVLVLDDGKGTGARPGQVLRRD
jgi:N-acyl-D-amino-acid deacylase